MILEVITWLVWEDIATLHPQISITAVIALTLPMSTADVERLFPSHEASMCQTSVICSIGNKPKFHKV